VTKDGQSPTAASGAHDVSELIGWHPYLPVAPEPRERREVSAGMTDKQVLAFYRDRDFDPYMTMSTARALRALALKHRSTVQAMVQAERDAAEAQRRRCRDIVSGVAPR
jgi:hypothetical protein